MSASGRTTAYYGRRRNVGAYEQPFSGVGMEFEPLGAAPANTGIVLHETGYWPNAHAWNFPDVYSPFWRVYYFSDAGHCVRFADRMVDLGPDRVLVIPNHQRFDCVGDEPVTQLWFAFSSQRNADPSQPMPIIIPMTDTIAGFVGEFPSLFRSRRSDRRERIQQLSLSFVLYVLNHPRIRWQDPLPRGIARVVAAVNNDPAAQWRNQSLAAMADMSADGFTRAFRCWLRTTPARYVQEVRIREACRLLAESRETIESIAQATGFADRFHFSRVFKQHTGTTPALYRRLHQA